MGRLCACVCVVCVKTEEEKTKEKCCLTSKNEEWKGGKQSKGEVDADSPTVPEGVSISGQAPIRAIGILKVKLACPSVESLAR